MRQRLDLQLLCYRDHLRILPAASPALARGHVPGYMPAGSVQRERHLCGVRPVLWKLHRGEVVLDVRSYRHHTLGIGRQALRLLVWERRVQQRHSLQRYV